MQRAKGVQKLDAVTTITYETSAEKRYTLGSRRGRDALRKFARRVERVMRERGIDLNHPVYVDVREHYRGDGTRGSDDDSPQIASIFCTNATRSHDAHIMLANGWAFDRFTVDEGDDVIAHELCHAIDHERNGGSDEMSDRFQSILEDHDASSRLRDHRDPDEFYEGHP